LCARAFTEISGGIAVTCAPMTVKFMPAGSGTGTASTLVRARPARGGAPEEIPALRPTRPCSIAGCTITAEGGAARIPAAPRLCHMDSAAALAIEGLMLELLALASRRSVRRRRRASPRGSPRLRLHRGRPGNHLGVVAWPPPLASIPSRSRAFHKFRLPWETMSPQSSAPWSCCRTSQLPLAEIAIAMACRPEPLLESLPQKGRAHAVALSTARRCALVPLNPPRNAFRTSGIS
jgi:hypothetical protein